MYWVHTAISLPTKTVYQYDNIGDGMVKLLTCSTIEFMDRGTAKYSGFYKQEKTIMGEISLLNLTDSLLRLKIRDCNN